MKKTVKTNINTLLDAGIENFVLQVINRSLIIFLNWKLNVSKKVYFKITSPQAKWWEIFSNLGENVKSDFTGIFFNNNGNR